MEEYSYEEALEVEDTEFQEELGRWARIKAVLSEKLYNVGQLTYDVLYFLFVALGLGGAMVACLLMAIMCFITLFDPNVDVLYFSLTGPVIGRLILIFAVVFFLFCAGYFLKGLSKSETWNRRSMWIA